jgi:hypothetical protein
MAALEELRALWMRHMELTTLGAWIVAAVALLLAALALHRCRNLHERCAAMEADLDKLKAAEQRRMLVEIRSQAATD